MPQPEQPGTAILKHRLRLGTFSIGPVSGEGWRDQSTGTNLVVRARGPKQSTYELDAFASCLTNSFDSWEHFAAYVRGYRTSITNDHEIVTQWFRPTQRFGKTELEYYVKYRFAKEGKNYTLQHRGYDFIHPASSGLCITLAYKELCQGDDTNSVRYEQAQKFFGTFRPK